MYSHLSGFLKQRKFIATGLVFSFNALLFAFWIVRIPEIKSTLGLGDADLGFALFFMPVGALLAMTSVSLVIQRFGAGRTAIYTSLLFVFCVLLPFLSSSFWMLGVSLFFLGLSSGAMDIAMNAVAATLEKEHKTEIMSTCHGFFSLGGMIGAGIGSVCLALHIDGVVQMMAGMAFVCAMLFTVVLPAVFHVEEEEASNEGAHFALPGKALVGLAIVAFCSMQGEGGVADWSAVYMEQVAMAEPYMWALAFMGCSMSMTIVRFAGDSIVAKVGAQKVIYSASMVVVIGLMMILPGLPWLSIAGFSVCGVGYALLVPVVFSEAGKQPGVSSSKSIAAVATFGYFGFLVGPVLIGFISEIFSLRIGFVYLIVFTILAVISFYLVEKKLK